MKQFGFENLNDTPPSFDEIDFSEFHSQRAWENYYQYNGHMIEDQVLQASTCTSVCLIFTVTFTIFQLQLVFPLYSL